MANFPYSWHISRNDGKFHTKTDYSKGINQEKGKTNKSEYSFQTQKSKTKALRPYEFVERRIILLRFSQKEQTSNKVYRFSDKQPTLSTLSERPHGRMKKGILEVFSDGVNPKIKFSRNKSIFTRSHIF